MAYYDALTAKWPSVTGATTADKIVALNAVTVAGPSRPVPILDAVNYLREQGVWLSIKAAAAAVDYNGDLRASTIDFSLAMPQAMLAALVSSGLITSAQSTALVAMGATASPWWEANGYSSPINDNDLIAAGGLT